MSVHLAKLLDITSLLSTRPALDFLTKFLSLGHCPSGEVSRVYFGKIHKKKTVVVETAHGFKDDECYPGKEFPVEITRPSGRAILENQIIFETNGPEFLEKYPSLKSEPILHPWTSQVSIPINDHYLLSCGKYSEFIEGDDLYYKNLRSLIQIYFAKLGKVSLEIGDLCGKPLTSRQTEILKLMKLGMTNEEIADKIGYSGSLVKQETMLIFSKLGISGRKDLSRVS
jgi:DNA-binding CsgD family transcriptional regulator